MEQNESLFSLTIDPVTKAHLGETAKWARFLAIVGMVSLGLLILIAVIFGTVMSGAGEAFTGGTSPFGAMGGLFIVVIYIILALVWFFPLLYLLRFANGMRTALDGNDQQQLNSSFLNLKACFRYVGIVTIIILVLYALVFVVGIIAAATLS